MSMFEFTKRSRKILEVRAHAEARRLNSTTLEPEHILIALLNDEESVAARILKNLGVSFDQLRDAVEDSVRNTDPSIILGKVPVSEAFRRIIELARDEAKKLKNSYIGTEHLLLALFRDGHTAGINSLVENRVDYNSIRVEILRVLGVKVGNRKSTQKKPDTRQDSLEDYTIDLTAGAKENKLDPVIGREREIERLIRILLRKRKNNPILIGEAGVGKTAIVEGLAMKIVANDVPDLLRDYHVLSLDMASIVAGTKYRGEFEERLKKIVKELTEKNDTVVFIDEIHTIIGAGAAEGAIDAANILKPALARGELQCIGATTTGEYRQYIEKDAALVRRFQPIQVEAPDANETLTILRGLKNRYENHHKVEYSESALQQAVYLADRYIAYRELPDTAIDIIDEAGSMARMESHGTPPIIISLEEELEQLQEEKNVHVQNQEYEKAAALRDTVIVKKARLEALMNDWQERKNEFSVIVDEDIVARVVAETTGIPVENIEESELDRLNTMEERLRERVIGQNHAISSVTRAIRRGRLGIAQPHRPLGSFIFLGPTGVGKTELARSLAWFLFNDERSLIRLDMSEYMERHAVARLIGAPPGYVGFDEGGQLTEKIKRKPFSVILFDEIEKAHPDVFNILLQVLEEGELTDSTGLSVSFRDTVIILTSNIGTRQMAGAGRMGFLETTGADVDNERIHTELKSLFSPELLNRLDEVVVFKAIEKKEAMDILGLLLKDLQFRLGRQQVTLDISSKLKEYLLEEGYSREYGVRNLKRILQQQLEDPLTTELLRKNLRDTCHVKASLRKGKVVFTVRQLELNDETVDSEIIKQT